jgi:hypothetical protein
MAAKIKAADKNRICDLSFQGLRKILRPTTKARHMAFAGDGRKHHRLSLIPDRRRLAFSSLPVQMFPDY